MRVHVEAEFETTEHYGRREVRDAIDSLLQKKLEQLAREVFTGTLVFLSTELPEVIVIRREAPHAS